MLRIHTIFVVVFLFATSVFGQNMPADWPKCAAIESHTERLACFDRLSKVAGVDKPRTTATSGPGKWRTSISRSPIDDSETVVVSIEAESNIKGWPSKSVRPSLVIRCREKKTQVYVTSGMTAAGDTSPVRVRLDKEPVQSEKWSNSTDHEAVFYPKSDIDFVRKLIKHTSMLFEILPFNSSATFTTFNLSGLETAIQPLTKACNWNLTSSNKPPPKRDNVSNSTSKDVAPPSLNQQIAAGEIEAVRQQISKCWNLPAGARDANFIVTIRATVAPDGTVTSATVEDRSRMTDPLYRGVAESAQRAMLNPACQPLKFPLQKYELWKNLRLTFNPKDVIG